MIIKKSIIFSAFTIGVLGACAEKNKREEQKQEDVKVETTKVMVEVKQTISEEERKEKDSIARVLDSIKQVKEHGHVH